MNPAIGSFQVLLRHFGRYHVIFVRRLASAHLLWKHAQISNSAETAIDKTSLTRGLCGVKLNHVIGSKHSREARVQTENFRFLN